MAALEPRTNGKVRRYTPRMPEARKAPPPPQEPRRTRQYSRYTNPQSENIARLRGMRGGTKGGRFSFTPEQVDMAMDVCTLMSMATHRGAGSAELVKVTELKERLGDDLFNVLHDFLHAGHGFEAIEKEYGFSARSAKVLLRVALQQIEHFDLVGDVTLLGAEGQAVAEASDPDPNPAMAGRRSVRPVPTAEWPK